MGGEYQATDARAAASLDPKRRGAVVYIGDGQGTVGELSLANLKKRLARLPRPVRLSLRAISQARVDVTKRLHNRIHGQPGDGGALGTAELSHLVAVSSANAGSAADRISAGDLVLLHDPQTAGLAGPLIQGRFPRPRCPSICGGASRSWWAPPACPGAVSLFPCGSGFAPAGGRTSTLNDEGPFIAPKGTQRASPPPAAEQSRRAPPVPPPRCPAVRRPPRPCRGMTTQPPGTTSPAARCSSRA